MSAYGRWERLRLFVRDYCQEFGIAWSLARMNDCERSGGHYWGLPTQDDFGMGWVRVCSKCRCAESVETTFGTTTATASLIGRRLP